METAARKSWQNSLADDADRFLRFVTKRVQDFAQAEDLFQDAFLKALQSDEGPKDEEKVEAWFYRILRNVIVDAYRKQAAETKKVSAFERESDVLLYREQIADLSCDCAAFFLKRINPEYAKILKELDLSGTPLAAYAKKHGLTIGAAKVKRHRARQALKREIVRICRCLVDRSVDCECPSLREK